ncbi:MAG: family 43 glycosylhydrolase [Clostridia bacterium]|nr:family 43 glycosylhydrolase [Clostridia bacterium]
MKLKDIYIRDPFILVEGGKYYMYGSTDPQTWKGKADGFKAYVSDDLENFEEHVVFENTDDFWGEEQFWAPEVHKYEGKYYLFAAFSKGDGVRRCQLLRADNPLGPFVPYGGLLFPNETSNLDATFFSENGKRYTVYCREWTDIKDGEMRLAELDENLRVKGEIKTLFKASDAPWTAEVEEGCFVTDGPFIRKNSRGEYVMLWSSHGKEGYAMGMAIAKSLDGEWKHIEKPLVSDNGGHGMIFEKDGRLFVTYHMPNEPHMSERAHIEEIEEADGIFRLKRGSKK